MEHSEWAFASKAHLKHQFEHPNEQDPTLRTLVYPSGCIRERLFFELDATIDTDPENINIRITAVDFENYGWVLLSEKFLPQELIH